MVPYLIFLVAFNYYSLYLFEQEIEQEDAVDLTI